MTSVAAIMGLPVVSTNTAEHLGTLGHPVVDIDARRVVAWQVGSGRKAGVVEQASLSAIGASAAMAEGDSAVRDPHDLEEQEVLKGNRVLIGSRVLSDAGNVIGTLDDADIDTDTGQINAIRTSAGDIEADRLRGFGSYAVVVTA